MQRDTLLAKRMRSKGYSESAIVDAHHKIYEITSAAENADADPMKVYDEYAAFVKSLGLTVDEVTYDDDAPNDDEFDFAYETLGRVLAPFGNDSPVDANAAYFILADNYGTRELLVEVIDESNDWTAARAAVLERFVPAVPGWSVILRFPDRPDEILGPARQDTSATGDGRRDLGHNG